MDLILLFTILNSVGLLLVIVWVTRLTKVTTTIKSVVNQNFTRIDRTATEMWDLTTEAQRATLAKLQKQDSDIAALRQKQDQDMIRVKQQIKAAMHE